MKTLREFTPDHQVVETMFPNPNVTPIIQEPMVFGADERFAWDFGGPLTRAVLTKIRETKIFMRDRLNANGSRLHCVIDTRSHMLMKGQYPAIGGWHCDFYPRGSSGQPDVTKGHRDSFHYVVTLSSNKDGVSCTEFVNDKVIVEVDDERVWKSVHEAVEAQKPNTLRIKDGDILRFSQETIHRATPTENPGWRFFLRLSFCHAKYQNEIRRQVQVYTPPENGW
jgi:hypothetical protein